MTLRNKNPIRLTPRETEIMHYMAMGKTREEVAQILGITLATVKTHIFNVRIRFDTTNVVQTVAISVARGLISVIV